MLEITKLVVLGDNSFDLCVIKIRKEDPGKIFYSKKNWM